MNQRLIIGVIGLAWALPAPAQPPEREVVRLTIRPQPKPVPALRYVLLPRVEELAPGNAITAYYKGFSTEWWGAIQRQPYSWWEKAEETTTAPLSKLSSEYAFLKNWRMLHEIDRGARRTNCDWEMLPQLKADGFGTLLPDVQAMRNYGRFLALRCRYELASGEIDNALYTLQTGFGLARHLGDGPTLIHMLVGVAIAQSMVKQLEELIAHPKCPSLYWAMANVPRPFIDMRRPIAGEALAAVWMLPEYDELTKGPVSQERAKKIFADFNGRLGNAGTQTNDVARVAEQFGVYPKAKAALVAAGRDRGEVEQMPVAQVLLLHSMSVYIRLRDEVFIWLTLPYHEAVDGIERADQLIKDAKLAQNTLGIAVDALPAIGRTKMAVTRLERRLAQLRAIEAIRLYTANHRGKLPASWTDLSGIPVPVDPVSNKPFEYKVEGATFSVTPAAVRGWELSGHSIHYDVTLEK
jgi:hypothetical protein